MKERTEQNYHREKLYDLKEVKKKMEEIKIKDRDKKKYIH